MAVAGPNYYGRSRNGTACSPSLDSVVRFAHPRKCHCTIQSSEISIYLSVGMDFVVISVHPRECCCTIQSSEISVYLSFCITQFTVRITCSRECPCKIWSSEISIYLSLCTLHCTVRIIHPCECLCIIWSSEISVYLSLRTLHCEVHSDIHVDVVEKSRIHTDRYTEILELYIAQWHSLGCVNLTAKYLREWPAWMTLHNTEFSDLQTSSTV